MPSPLFPERLAECRAVRIPSELDGDQRPRFVAKVAAAVRQQAELAESCPGILRVSGEIDEDGDRLLIPHEPATPADPAAPVQADQRPDVDTLWWLTAATLEALQAASAAKALHGGIQLGSLFLDEAGRPKLGDFGIAPVFEGLGARDARRWVHCDTTAAEDRHGRTLSGTWRLLTPEDTREVGWIAPYFAHELLERDLRLNFKADQFALGVLLFLLATGEHPYEAAWSDPSLNLYFHLEPFPLEEARPDWAEAFERQRADLAQAADLPVIAWAGLVGRLLASDAAKRFDTPLAAQETLGTFVSPRWAEALRSLETATELLEQGDAEAFLKTITPWTHSDAIPGLWRDRLSTWARWVDARKDSIGARRRREHRLAAANNAFDALDLKQARLAAREVIDDPECEDDLRRAADELLGFCDEQERFVESGADAMAAAYLEGARDALGRGELEDARQVLHGVMQDPAMPPKRAAQARQLLGEVELAAQRLERQEGELAEAAREQARGDYAAAEQRLEALLADEHLAEPVAAPARTRLEAVHGLVKQRAECFATLDQAQSAWEQADLTVMEARLADVSPDLPDPEVRARRQQVAQSRDRLRDALANLREAERWLMEGQPAAAAAVAEQATGSSEIPEPLLQSLVELATRSRKTEQEQRRAALAQAQTALEQARQRYDDGDTAECRRLLTSDALAAPDLPQDVRSQTAELAEDCTRLEQAAGLLHQARAALAREDFDAATRRLDQLQTDGLPPPTAEQAQQLREEIAAARQAFTMRQQQRLEARLDQAATALADNRRRVAAAALREVRQSAYLTQPLRERAAELAATLAAQRRVPPYFWPAVGAGLALIACVAGWWLLVPDGPPDNHPPTANAGVDQTADEGDVVALAGWGTDPEGQSLNYQWVQTGGPQVGLSDATAVDPTFTAPEGLFDSEVTFELRVSDGQNTSDDTVSVTVNADNDAPSADAGPDRTADEGDAVTLAGGGSDPEGQDLTYRWVQTGGPQVALSDATVADPTFTAPEGLSDSEVTFELRVSDGENTSIDTVSVTVNADNDAPSADAGVDQSVDEGGAVTLSGSGTDPEGQNLTYQWVRTGGPDVTLSDATAASPTFIAPEGLPTSEITFELRVSDGTSTGADAVSVTVNAAAADPEPPVPTFDDAATEFLTALRAALPEDIEGPHLRGEPDAVIAVDAGWRGHRLLPHAELRFDVGEGTFSATPAAVAAWFQRQIDGLSALRRGGELAIRLDPAYDARVTIANVDQARVTAVDQASGEIDLVMPARLGDDPRSEARFELSARFARNTLTADQAGRAAFGTYLRQLQQNRAAATAATAASALNLPAGLRVTPPDESSHGPSLELAVFHDRQPLARLPARWDASSLTYVLDTEVARERLRAGVRRLASAPQTRQKLAEDWPDVARRLAVPQTQPGAAYYHRCRFLDLTLLSTEDQELVFKLPVRVSIGPQDAAAEDRIAATLHAGFVDGTLTWETADLAQAQAEVAAALDGFATSPSFRRRRASEAVRLLADELGLPADLLGAQQDRDTLTVQATASGKTTRYAWTWDALELHYANRRALPAATLDEQLADLAAAAESAPLSPAELVPVLRAVTARKAESYAAAPYRVGPELLDTTSEPADTLTQVSRQLQTLIAPQPTTDPFPVVFVECYVGSQQVYALGWRARTTGADEIIGVADARVWRVMSTAELRGLADPAAFRDRYSADVELGERLLGSALGRPGEPVPASANGSFGVVVAPHELLWLTRWEQVQCEPRAIQGLAGRGAPDPGTFRFLRRVLEPHQNRRAAESWRRAGLWCVPTLGGAWHGPAENMRLSLGPVIPGKPAVTLRFRTYGQNDLLFAYVEDPTRTRDFAWGPYARQVRRGEIGYTFWNRNWEKAGWRPTPYASFALIRIVAD